MLMNFAGDDSSAYNVAVGWQTLHTMKQLVNSGQFGRKYNKVTKNV